MIHNDEIWMSYAISLAKYAQEKREVPVGAVVTLNNAIIGIGWNNSIHSNDPTAHAEIIALRLSGIKLNNYRLIGASLYVTLEPCMMCMGAMINARISRLIFGAWREKTSLTRMLINTNNTGMKHTIKITAGVLASNCSEQLKYFFHQLRSH